MTLAPNKNGWLSYFIVLYHIIFHFPIFTPVLLCHFPFTLFSVGFTKLKRGEIKVEKEACLTFPCQTSCLEVQNPTYQRRRVWVGKEKTQGAQTSFILQGLPSKGNRVKQREERSGLQPWAFLSSLCSRLSWELLSTWWNLGWPRTGLKCGLGPMWSNQQKLQGLWHVLIMQEETI